MRADDINADTNLLTKAVQEDRRDLGRTMMLPPEVADAVDPTLPEPVANAGVVWNATANALVNKLGLASAVSGPGVGGSTDNAIARYDGVDGDIQDSNVLINDTDDVSGINDLAMGGNLAITGLVDGRDVAADGTKLDGIEALADVTDEANVVAALDGATLTGVPFAGADKALIQDADDSDNLKTITLQEVIDEPSLYLIRARVDEVAGINKGEVIFINGATGNKMEVSLADNTNFNESRAIAVAIETKANNADILCALIGELDGLDTSSFLEGDILYLGTAGTLTKTHPSGINAVIEVATVVRVHASLGIIFINIDSRTIIDNFDGIVRHEVVNLSTGVNAVSTFTAINDISRRMSTGITGSNHIIPDAGYVFSQGFNTFFFVNDGDKGFKWQTDQTDTHSAKTIEGIGLTILELTSDGRLLLDTDIYAGVAADTDADDVVVQNETRNVGFSVLVEETAGKASYFLGHALTAKLAGMELDNGTAKLNIYAGGAITMILDNALTQFQDQIRATKTLHLSKTLDIASATALVLLITGNSSDVTGTTDITSIGTSGHIGTEINLHFDGVLTLTHNATDLVLPGGVDILTAPGDEAQFIEYASGDWRCVNYQRNVPVDIESMQFAVSDETTDLATGTAELTFRMPYAFELTEIPRMSVGTAPTGGTLLTADINKSGSTILSTKLTIDASEKTSTTAATPAILTSTPTTFIDDEEITIDIDDVGSTIAGAGLKVTLIGRRIV